MKSMKMEYHETIIVGGGPAGSSCAWMLRKHGRDVLVLDKKAFPRMKLCAGWVSPRVLKDLEFSREDYPYGIIPLKIKTHIRNFPFPIPWFPLEGIHYSIRRIEFDAWLLKRSGAPFKVSHVKKLERKKTFFYLNDTFSCKYLVGAGGTLCPVRKTFFPHSRNEERQIITLEKEFEYPHRSDWCHLQFFQKGMKGYAWYIPKGNGFVNIGLGGYVKSFKASGKTIHAQFRSFLNFLIKKGLLDLKQAKHLKAKGHPYYSITGIPSEVKKQNCFLVGDSAGLATLDLGEGIAPAVESGLLAAREILHLEDYHSSKIEQFSISNQLIRSIIKTLLSDQSGNRRVPLG